MSTSLASHVRRNAAALLALLMGLLITAGATTYIQRGVDLRREQLFEDATQDGSVALQQRLDVYQAMLLGTRGVFTGSEAVERREFRAYTESLEVRQRYPGIQAIGLARWLRQDELPRHEARMRAEGFSAYRVWPEQARAHHAVVDLVEPFDVNNIRVLGFDVLSEPARRVALERAMRSGLPTATGKVQLVSEPAGQAGQEGFVIYVPLYAGMVEPTTPQARGERLEGFVFGAFRMKDFVEGLRFPGFQSTIDLTLYDGATVSEPARLYSSLPGAPDAGGLQQRLTVQVAGVPWTLVFNTREAFMTGTRSSHPTTVAGGGLLMSLLLFLVTRSQVNARAHAEQASAEHRRLADEAQAAVRVRDEFLSVAAHELRTPITSLKLQLQLLFRQLRQPGPLDTERLERGVETCERQTTRLTKLVDSLLDVARLSSGRMELQLEDVELGELVRELARRFEMEAQSAGVRLEVDAPEPMTGRWDRLRLEQVLTNLMSNALKYGHGAPVDVRVLGDVELARVEVRDRGIGIAPEDAARVFDRFERAVSSRHYGGLGLGLFITRQLVEAHGGRIFLESHPGEGTTFIVHLPRAGPPLRDNP
ncbi:CHASE domain-containing protein [Myxococcus sp. K38C18041901]|uniref:CHASE domain-containing protein n=1 Tax=Myxococcus guangdongensis TaxID=2906760 RepID=UPI0020A766D1|nr:CHASE domain-containing protein [Myxococcus guangdongensis]MCP3059074.1 CHASE domain-containing protein [Myxococcus guangdongensis]